jgi:uncharacterized cupredoxin-like copper-binding protein
VIRHARFAASLAALVAAAAPASADDVVVRLVDDQFEPAELVLEHGNAYRLHLENRGKELHEFKAAKFFATAKLANRSALTPDGTEVVLQPGQTADVELVAPAPGTYELTCPDHDWEGMVGKIIVR